MFVLGLGTASILMVRVAAHEDKVTGGLGWAFAKLEALGTWGLGFWGADSRGSSEG